MTQGEMIFSLILAAIFVAWVLFVIFGQVTVRKLRKNPETKYELGIEFVSGWDILNVAQALSLPEVLEKRLKNKAFHANSDLLYKHTTVFDRVLARMFCTLFVLSGLALIVFGVLDWFGVFD
ncbi:MAG: hypothetical protein L3J88_07555 [Gammaproteobacteria bacterium]|nr:hypothetical protein [Gammaproteobacteria bacterium]